jgi:hypothetical protein
MAGRDEWLMPLAAGEIAEIENATKVLVARDADIASINARDFPLPALGPKLRARVRDEVLNGRGFLLMRGLPVERWTIREAATAYFGLGAHIGSARSQNGKGHVLGHVRDLGLDAQDPNVRIYQTNARQTFHTDSCDVVGLLCLKTAQSGGLSALVSSTTIFNEMRRSRPDLLKLLLEPIATDRRGEVPKGRKPYFEIPVFTWHQGFLTAIYQRQYIDSAQRFPDAPRLTPAHIEARPVRQPRRRSQAAHVHGVQARRHPDRAQSHAAARSHRLRGLAGAGAAPAPAAAVAGGKRCAAAAGDFRRALRQRDGRRPRRHRRPRHQAPRAIAGGLNGPIVRRGIARNGTPAVSCEAKVQLPARLAIADKRASSSLRHRARCCMSCAGR